MPASRTARGSPPRLGQGQLGVEQRREPRPRHGLTKGFNTFIDALPIRLPATIGARVLGVDPTANAMSAGLTGKFLNKVGLTSAAASWRHRPGGGVAEQGW